MSSNEMRMIQTRSVAVGSQPLSMTRGELLAGLQAGALAGLVMGTTVIAISFAMGLGLWTPFNDVAAALNPALAAGSAFSPLSTISGFLVHFAIACVLGIVFAALYCGVFKLTFDFGVPLTIGLAFGMITWFFARFSVLPALNSLVYEAPAFVIVHAIYGATLGLLYPLMPARKR